MRAERSATLRLDVVDDIAGAQRNGALGSCVLGLGFEGLAAGDEVVVKLNGLDLTWRDRRLPADPWTRQAYTADWASYPSRLATVPFESEPVEFDLEADWLHRGRNLLEIRLAQRAADASTALVLTDVRVSIRYVH